MVNTVVLSEFVSVLENVIVNLEKKRNLDRCSERVGKMGETEM